MTGGGGGAGAPDSAGAGAAGGSAARQHAADSSVPRPDTAEDFVLSDPEPPLPPPPATARFPDTRPSTAAAAAGAAERGDTSLRAGTPGARGERVDPADPAQGVDPAEAIGASRPVRVAGSERSDCPDRPDRFPGDGDGDGDSGRAELSDEVGELSDGAGDLSGEASDPAASAEQASLVEDLLAPFDRVRPPRPPSGGNAPQGEGASPPPPPASARLPDAPPLNGRAPTRTDAPQAPAPVVPPPRPGVPPRPAGTPEPPDAASAATLAKASGTAAAKPSRTAPAMEPGTAARSRAAAAPRPPQPTDAGQAGGTGSPGSAGNAGKQGNPKSLGNPRTPGNPRNTTQAHARAFGRRRAVGAVDLTPGPGTGRPFVFLARPTLYDDTTTRLRPVGAWAGPRVAAAAACAVLGLGLIGGAATGSWLTGESDAAGGSRNAYVAAGKLWHSVPVDRLFPPSIKGEGAGPGGADRTWNRLAVAPDSGCAGAFDPLLRKALAPAGCLRLLRATYADATSSHVTTVGLLFTKADAEAMNALRGRFTEEGLDSRPDLMPRPYAAKGTPAAGFGDLQRATWTLSVLPDAPVVAYAVSGFADGRTVTEPEPAAEAMRAGATSAPAQAGLGNDAKGIADRVERGLRKTVDAATEKPS
nr:hypothetical protein [Streptomyces typhae]